MKRDVLFSTLFFAATVGVGAASVFSFPTVFSFDVSAQEAIDDDFHSVAPDEFELASNDAENDAAEQEENAGAEPPTLELPGVVSTDENETTSVEVGASDVETLPPEAISPPSERLKAETVVDDAERKRLENDPLFREFSAAFDEAAPLPAIPELETTIGGEKNVGEEEGSGDDFRGGKPSRGAVPEAVPSSGRLALELDAALAIGAVDLNSLDISSENRATLERLDVEISRLCPLWIDAELNKNVVGRRERIWRRDEPTRFETNEPEPVASDSDWALAPDAPFFFQVVDSGSGDVFYTKAGDFEPVDGAPALVRDGRTFVLSLEPGPGVPSGRAERTRILIDGKIQGVDASGKRVVDFNLGTIQLYMFDNPARLESADGVFFAPTPESGEPRLTKLPPNSKIGVRSGKLLLSNGRSDELFSRIVLLCKSKKRLVEILTQPRLGTK